MLIATAAMGFVALGAAGVGTLAWYQASAATTVNKTPASNNSLTTVTSSTNLGSFTLTVTLGDASNTVGLTDDAGNTYVYATGDTTTPIAADVANRSATVAVGLTLSYSGSLSTAAEKDAAWQASAAAVTVTITDTTSTYNPSGYISGEGLKFSKSAFGSVGTANSYKGADSVNWSVTADSLKGLHFSDTPSLSLSVGTLYVAVKGLAGQAQVDHAYQIKGTVA